MTRLALLLPMIVLAACQPAANQSNDVARANNTAMANDMAMTNGAAMTGDQDRDFATMMTGHHKNAIEMARVELNKGKDPEMRALATKIIADQQREIGQMDAYLAKPKS